MPDHRTYVYSNHGRLSYIPDHLLPSNPPRGLYRTRARRPHRICIASVVPDPPTPNKYTSTSAILVEKLASSRQSAKRFLRSFVSNSNNSNNNSQQDQENLESRRASLQITPQSSASSRSESRRSSHSSATQSSGMRSNRSSVVGGGGGGGGVAPALTPRPPLLVTTSSRAASHVRNRMSKSMSASVTRLATDEKPLASGNGVSIAIHLTEPVLFLQGFDQNEHSERSTAMLRGSLHLHVTKPTKIKTVTLNFAGRALTKWPEGIPPRKTEFEEKNIVMKHVWPFFNAQFPTAEASTGADHVELLKSSGASPALSPLDSLRNNNNNTTTGNGSALNLTSRDHRKLSLQVNQSRSFGKGDSSTNGPSVAQKGYRTFQPGDYVYNFELPIDSHLPETIDVELGSVKYELEAIIERAGAFRANLMGTKEIQLIRAPSEGSLEQIEPIAISRNWEDQLHYDIVISGKSFPIGAQVPIAFKLTPLAKVQCHRIKVYVTENVEYFCQNKKVHRLEPTRKIQLFEKRADGPATSVFPGSTMRIVSGGGVRYDEREAAARGEEVTLQDTTNLLGNLGDYGIGPTEMEFNVQLPTCSQLKDKERSQRLHFDTTYQNIVVHHWIKLVMRLSRPDTNNPEKRRHFEISIDSPFNILSCRATQSNTSLPAYSSPECMGEDTQLSECGCPGAATRRGSPTSFAPTLELHNGTRGTNEPTDISSPGLARPQQAHLGGPIHQELARPMHLLRIPSYNPPAFEEEQPPPPLETPPPAYNSIASPTSGLADYFARLSDAYDDEDDSEDERTRRSRIDVPLTPGGRIARSMDVPRTYFQQQFQNFQLDGRAAQ
ncbi:hypothetical protein EJ05DRAFT_471765 [Pseudovirgaria hyperparasitica]|uniref:Arrestin C-terminal-like domain-containing protein n=1 Tax=Pseudovirgaria hyperparasitica TaxID=470096 RepID=A0A6A6WKT1_9PEZI|nr:uncharacterized protein EJ05DRAFT_471765 [Pseudovirgaria hyperparasitica]KAF2762805.1 hypothetical protein EJ05DRAFT_471765 [Pseudovirgaria hyperparasitica]